MNLIFDIDGTLWDTTKIVAKAWQQAVDETDYSNVTLTAKQLKGEFGKPMDVIAENIFPDVPSKEDRDKLITLCCEHEDSKLGSLSDEEIDDILFDGVRETLTKLREEHDLFIVSNCQKGYIELFLEKSRLGHLFKDFLCYGDTLAPKGVTIKQLMNNNRLLNKHTLYIGDTVGDYQATLLAGVPFVYCKYGFGEVTGAQYEIEKFSDLL